ncbi:putative START domain-containing protein [Helianthus annuus]|nr:uncharacterized protein LOC110899531 [Helianthus annuus]KAF5774653.1 putative START domain-containing protein [Helianthus annuus]KAJ0477960.1 putative START domain-containing protein [Helianthus annuus]KAJ0477961.1 putative START domain-containing protein [Helianthus annuus]KAJ0482564.1 putative START domain-containing protein [Helianthus annuus]KAJ0498810.1 putative START domain-containing protein [Helianthus annuus]
MDVIVAICKVLPDVIGMIVPIWVAVVFGVLVGWLWRPKWARSAIKNLAIPTKSSFVSVSGFGFPKVASSEPSTILFSDTSSSSKLDGEMKNFVGEEDLKHISKLVNETDGGPAWIGMMDKSTSNMSYQAWRRDPETGPPQYRSRTVYEDMSPEMMRDFFWDDEFRLKWDDMLLEAETIEECPNDGTMVVKWVRKFPFFCSDREYIIGRRIWESGKAYYCVTKGVQYPSVPRRTKPRRVDLYYSSWFIRAVESRKGDGQMSACEVLLFHHEDMGIPWEIAKLGVRQGMWGAVKNIDRGLRRYQKHMASGAPLSHCAYMAHVNSKICTDRLKQLENTSNDSQEIVTCEQTVNDEKKPSGKNIPKLLVVGGAIALACTIDRGLLSKAVILGVARRFAKVGRRL